MKKIQLTVLYISLLMVLSVSAYAQGPGFDDDVIDEVPFDGGVSLLAAAGIGYGIKKIKESKEKQK